MASRESKDKIPTSRVRRTATVGKLAASEAVKQFGTRAANVTRSDQASEEALARRQLETAKQIVAALGTMKGAAMKLGQVMSFLDVGLVGEEYREEFQQELAKLRDAAPTVSFKQMRRVIEDDLEAPIAELFDKLRRGADRGRLDRAGVQGHAPRRPSRRRQGSVPRGRSRGPRRHAEPGHDHAAAQAHDAWARRKGGRHRDQGADRRGARLRARGPEPELVGAHLSRSPVHRRARRRHGPVARARARDRARRRRRLRGAQAPPAARARSRRGDHLPLLPRLPVQAPPVLGRPPSGQFPAARRRARRVPGLRPVQAHGARAGRARARLPAGRLRG